jgi:hypothetical protein
VGLHEICRVDTVQINTNVSNGNCRGFDVRKSGSSSFFQELQFMHDILCTHKSRKLYHTPNGNSHYTSLHRSNHDLPRNSFLEPQILHLTSLAHFTSQCLIVTITSRLVHVYPARFHAPHLLHEELAQTRLLVRLQLLAICLRRQGRAGSAVVGTPAREAARRRIPSPRC